MLFHVDMMCIAKQAKRDLEKVFFFVFSLTMPLPLKVPDVKKEQIYVYTLSR